MIETDIGTVFVSNHARDRMERHGIEKEYVGRLIDVAEWQESGEDLVAFVEVEADGVEWKVVIAEEEEGRMKHDWDLVTVSPESVDLDAAEESFGEVTALNLAMYSD